MTDIASVESFDEALVAFFLGCQDIYNRHIMRLRKGTPEYRPAADSLEATLQQSALCQNLAQPDGSLLRGPPVG